MEYTELKPLDNLIQLTVSDNPFTRKAEIYNVEPASFRELFTQYTRNRYPIEQAVIYDTDTRIFDFDSLPSTDLVTIQIVPSITATVGVMAVSILIFGTLVGVAVGVVALIGFIQNTRDAIDSLSERVGMTEQLNQSRGATNQHHIGGRVPLVFGKHLITPVFGGNTYVTVSSGSNTQVIHQLFVVGYKDVQILNNTNGDPDIRYGDMHISEFTNNYDINYGTSAQHARYPARVTPAFPQTAIYRDIAGGASGSRSPSLSYFKGTSPAKTKKMDFGFSFNRGLCAYTDSNVSVETSIIVYIRLHDITMNTDYFLIPGTSPDATRNYLTIGKSGGANEISVSVEPATVIRLESFPAAVRFTGNTTTPSRVVFSIYLPGVAAWTSMRDHAFEIIISPTYETERNVTYRINDTYIEFINFYTYGASILDDSAIVDSVKKKLTTLAVTFQPVGNSVNLSKKLNVLAQLQGKDFVGTSGQTGPAHWTAGHYIHNPASLFLYALTDPLCNQDYSYNPTLVDWTSFEEWWTFCNNGGGANDPTNPLMFNKVYSNATTVEEILDDIANVGYASWILVDGLISFVIDIKRTAITQYFTPKNSKNFSGYKSFEDPFDAIEVKYTDPSTWLEDSITVYATPGAPTELRKTAISVPGITSYTNAQRFGQYVLNSIILRPEKFSFTAYNDAIVCTSGDRIKLQHDAALIGGGIAGRFIGFDYSDPPSNTLVRRIYVDELFEFEYGNTYKLLVRPIDPSTSTTVGSDTISNMQYISVINPAPSGGPATNEIADGIYAFDIPSPYYVNADLLEVHMLYVPGITGLETIDLLVDSIDYKDEVESTINCIIYDENVYALNTVPAYPGVMTTPPSVYGTSSYSMVYNIDDLLGLENALSADMMDNPSYGQVIEGITNSGTITSLSTPVVAITSFARSINIVMAHGDDVAGGSLRYELQISDDEVTWYSINNPCNDPSDASDETYKTSWQGVEGGITVSTQNSYIHNKVPYDGSQGIPIAKTYYYRVRAVSGITAVVRSDWETLSVDAVPLITLDIEEGAITANKIDVVSLTADSAFIENLTAASAFIENLTAASAFIEDIQAIDLAAESGTIGGWDIFSGEIRSGNELTRLRSSENRLQIDDALGTVKVALGYLGSVPGHTSDEFGLYVADGNTVSFSSGAAFEEGSYFINADAAFVAESGGAEAIRLGSLGGGDIGLDIGSMKFGQLLGGGGATGDFEATVTGGGGATGTFGPVLGGGNATWGNAAGLLYSLVEDKLYLTGTLIAADGVFSGSLEAATGTFTGDLVAAGGTFSGALEAASGTFTGTVSAGTITGTTISGGTITGTSINIGSGTFQVSSAGVITATTGNFSGDITGANGTFSGTLGFGVGDSSFKILEITVV